MAHRSNQAVASQAGPEPGIQTRKARIRWRRGLALTAAGLAAMLGGVWIFRIPLADALLRASLAQNGAETDFQILNLDFSHATIANLRLGPAARPDAAARLIELELGWNGPFPQLRALRIVEPRLRFSINPHGALDAGALTQATGARGGAGRRPSLPRARVSIENGEALIDAPFGALTMTFNGHGTLGHDFSAAASLAETTRPGEMYGLDKGRAELSVISQDNRIAFRLAALADSVVWNGARVNAPALAMSGDAPLDLSRAALQASAGVAALESVELSARGATIVASIKGAVRGDKLAYGDWRAQVRGNATTLARGDDNVRGVAFNASGIGNANQGTGQWRLQADELDGFGLISHQPDATGDIAFNLDAGETHARAQVSLARSSLDGGARRRLAQWIPNAGGSPVGPTFAQLEGALLRAADAFTLTAPVSFTRNGEAMRLRATGDLAVRGANGVALSFAPPNANAPAIALDWPEQRLYAAGAATLTGGGAPDLVLTVQNLERSPQKPLGAHAMLAVRAWRTPNASIAAGAIELTLTTAAEGGGQLDIAGPVRISGPVGDGAMRDMSTNLDLVAAWRDGWRVAPREPCMPISIEALEVTGLAFRGGDVNLCTAGGALVTADARGNLSGGFDIAGLHLNGRTAGAGGTPARLNASRVTGRFGGTQSNVLLAVEASSPTLAMDFPGRRTLSITGRRVTANARFGETWRVDGLFDEGVLTDPALPGVVSAIAGKWNAVPERGDAVVRVQAGEARIDAYAAGEGDDRPLFNPLRLTEVGAVVRNGEIDAQGRVLLEAGARGLAAFTAHHRIDSGVGQARVHAADLQFSEGLQPFEISEMARGVFENVRGHAAVTAAFAWTREQVTATGVLSPRGLSLATPTVPIIEDINGDVRFDDLFAFTTPPGQEVTVGLVNPGMAARNGRVRFQLLPDNNLAIESAAFEFARGVLGVAPATFALDAPEIRLELTLSNVDVAALVAEMNMPDLRATGHVEGRFPLRLTRTTAFVEGGVLRAQAPGGDIAYVGTAGDATTGPARVAFDALRSFRYDALELKLDGDLSGEVVTEVSFRGENSGRPVNLAPIASTSGLGPGLGNVSVRGVPFAFNVTVRAPFRRLAETAAGVSDARVLIDRATQTPQNPGSQPPPVDQPPPAQR